MPSINNLATTTTTLNGVESKIINVSTFVQKTDCNKKNSEIWYKITTDHDHHQYIIA